MIFQNQLFTFSKFILTQIWEYKDDYKYWLIVMNVATLY